MNIKAKHCKYCIIVKIMLTKKLQIMYACFVCYYVALKPFIA